MDINKFKESLKSLAQKNAEFVKANFKTNNRQFTKSSFENCRSELFLSELYKQFKELCCGEMSAECFKRGVLRILSTYEDECKIIPSCLYVKAKTDLFPGRIIDDMVSLAYEPLLNIFYYSDQDFRLQYFHELLTYYYTILMQHLSSDVSSVLHSELWENLVKTSIPLVKLDLLLKLYDSSSFKCSSTVKTLIMELYEIIEYPEILIEDCYKIVENKLKSRNYKLLNYKLVPFSERPGFLGDYFRLHVTVEYEMIQKTFQMFAKFLPTTNETVKDISILAFKKEAFIYRDFIPKLKEVGFQGIADIAPDCYFIRTGNVMVFDDLPISNYTSSDLSIPEGYEWLSLAFKKLAQFHACSILLENKCDMKIESEYKEYLNEVFWAREESSSGGVMKCSVRTTIEYFVSKFPDLLKYSTLNECKRKIESAFDLMYRQIIMSEKHMNVICHGDVWAANILTKKVENIPKSCYLIDFQLIRYCPPMVDVLFLLYMNTTKQIRSEYKLKLLDIYYEAQMNILKEYNMNIEDIYSKQDFLSLYREFESTAICQAICYQQILLVPKKTLHAINNDELISKNFYQIDRSDIFDEVLETDEEYRTRMRAIMEDLYDVLDI